MLNIFKKKANTTKKEDSNIDIFVMKYRDNNTGEIHTFDGRDSKTFNEIMSRKDVTLIIG